VPFNNLNSFFHNVLGVVNFTTRRKKFKLGTGQFDYILDLPINEDRTLKYRFDYLEKKPLRKLEVAKFSLGFPINNPALNIKQNELFSKEEKEQYEKQFKDEYATVLLMELIDVNDSYNHKEIKKRTKLLAGESGDKYLYAYTFKPSYTEDQMANVKERGKKYKVKIEGLNERDEVVQIKTLHHDLKKKEVVFQIVLLK